MIRTPRKRAIAAGDIGTAGVRSWYNSDADLLVNVAYRVSRYFKHWEQKMSYQISGTATYQSLGTGFWSILAPDDGKYRPVKMPEELQVEGLKLSATVEDAEPQVSVFMWGKSVKILNYKVESSSANPS
jgi:hypothetical protein